MLMVPDVFNINKKHKHFEKIIDLLLVFTFDNNEIVKYQK